MKHLIVAGGGTGGHVLAGVAIADAWKTQTGGTVSFVGAEGGIEEKLVPRAGYPLHLLKLGSLKRVSLRRKILTAIQLPLSILKSMAVLIQEKPNAVIGVGGYASGPLVLMARLIGWLWGAKVAVLEQNAVPGFTNRVLARFSHQVFSAFPGIESQFPGSQLIVTGNPVRQSMKPLTQAPREPFCIFVFGGSQGAVGINSLVLECIPLLGEYKNKIRWIHQTGEKDFERVKRVHQELGSQAQVEKFIYDMPAAYQQASLLICRAGSSTLSEISAVGRASILVPFPFASDNHQEKNARIYSDAGAAQVLVQFKAQGQDLAKIILDLIANPHQISKMEEHVKQFYRPAAAQQIVQNLEASSLTVAP